MMKGQRSARFARPSRDRPASANSRSPGNAVEINKGGKMPQGSWRPARRERGAYPGSVTGQQRLLRRPVRRLVRRLVRRSLGEGGSLGEGASWAAKEPGRLPPLFLSTAEDGPASGKVRRIPENPGKSRKKIKKHSASPQPPNKKNPRSHRGRL